VAASDAAPAECRNARRDMVIDSYSFIVGGTLPEAGASVYAFPSWSLGMRKTEGRNGLIANPIKGMCSLFQLRSN